MAMWRTYTVSQDKESGAWYAHKAGFSHIPVLGTAEKTRRAAQKHAANMMGLPIKDYMTLKEKKV